jgi:hypothetical protein
MNKPFSTIPFFTIVFSGLALLAANAWAAEGRPINETRPLKADARLSVSNVSGLIEVEAWGKNEMQLTGTLAPEVEKLIIEGDANHLSIEVKLPRRMRRNGDTILKLKVPAGIELEAEGVSADIKARGLKGPVEASSVSGDITLDVGSEKVEAQSVSGDVLVTAPGAEVRVETVSGDVTVRSAKGEVRSESVSGTVKVEARDVRRLDAESVSGDLSFDLQLARDAEVRVETLSGEVVMVLPSLPDLDLDFETFSGDLESAFGELVSETHSRKQHDDEDDEDDEDDDGRGKHYRRHGSGRGHMHLQSFSGDIILKKK